MTKIPASKTTAESGQKCVAANVDFGWFLSGKLIHSCFFLFNKALVKSTFQVTIWSALLCLLRRRALRYRLSSQPGRRWGWFAGSELHPVLQQAQLERQAHAGYKVVIKGINGEQILFPVMELGQADNGLVIIYPLFRVAGITVDAGN